jgi:hypothetical protein
MARGRDSSNLCAKRSGRRRLTGNASSSAFMRRSGTISMSTASDCAYVSVRVVGPMRSGATRDPNPTRLRSSPLLDPDWGSGLLRWLQGARGGRHIGDNVTASSHRRLRLVCSSPAVRFFCPYSRRRTLCGIGSSGSSRTLRSRLQSCTWRCSARDDHREGVWPRRGCAKAVQDA